MGLKLEVGKSYKTRDGRKVGPMIRDDGSIFHNHHSDRDLNMQVWNYDGSVYSECEGESGQTLISEWPADAAPTGPVRTVTRTTKEIVPGVYGDVRVAEWKIVSVYPMENAEQIRAAIATLTEIADALEEQA